MNRGVTSICFFTFTSETSSLHRVQISEVFEIVISQNANPIGQAEY